METYEKDLKGQTVCAALDGWSNIHNEPIVGVTIFSKDQIYLVDTIDTSGHPHEFEYLSEIAKKDIKTAVLDAELRALLQTTLLTYPKLSKLTITKKYFISGL